MQSTTIPDRALKTIHIRRVGVGLQYPAPTHSRLSGDRNAALAVVPGRHVQNPAGHAVRCLKLPGAMAPPGLE